MDVERGGERKHTSGHRLVAAAAPSPRGHRAAQRRGGRLWAVVRGGARRGRGRLQARAEAGRLGVAELAHGLKVILQRPRWGQAYALSEGSHKAGGGLRFMAGI